MSDLYNSIEQYRLEFSGVQLNHINDAINGLTGLVRLQEKCLDDVEQPEWWSDFYAGSVNSALRVLSSEISAFKDRIEQQALRNSEGEQ